MTDDDPQGVQDELERVRERLAAVTSAFEREQQRSAQWRRIALEQRRSAERLKAHPLVKLALPVARRGLPPVTSLGRRMSRSAGRSKRSLGRVRGVVHRIGAADRERDLLRSVGQVRPPGTVDGRLVSFVVLTRNGSHHLARLLPALRERTLHPATEVIVVDNDSGEATRAWLAEQPDVTVVRSSSNLSYSAANNLGARHARGEVLCFLNDDTEPVTRGWLPLMLEALQQTGVVAVGAQLVYPRQKLLTGRVRDIAVQHLGIDLVPQGSAPPRAANRGVGGRPDATADCFEAAAATGACLLVSATDYWAVGGFDERYHYGSEDVDLCWSLRQRGGRVVIVPAAVLFHHEGATRHRDDPAELRRRQAANRAALEQRYGPSMHRALQRDRIQGALRLTSVAFHVALAFRSDDAGRDSGGRERAEPLREALLALGWRVSLVDVRRTGLGLPAGLDALVVLDDTVDVRGLPEDITCVAWVATQADTWTRRPWFDDHDLVLASSAVLADQLAERSRHRPLLADGRSFARALQAALLERSAAPRVALVTGVPRRAAAPTWGDWHLALAMGRALEAHSVVVTVHSVEPRDVGRARSADALVHLHGRGEVPPAEGQLSVLWCISHPDELSPAACDAADLVLVASHTDFPADVRAGTSTEVGVLLQATDPGRFYPRAVEPRYAHDVAFVGNSRFVRRPVVDDALAGGLQPAVYGANWERFLPARLIRAKHVPNEELPSVYSSVRVLLNDHWADMRRCGIASNRLFDALACGTVVVSDELPGLEELFDGGVVTYSDSADLKRTVADLLADPAERQRRAERGRAAVLASHTFEHRAAELMRLLLPRLGATPDAAEQRGGGP